MSGRNSAKKKADFEKHLADAESGDANAMFWVAWDYEFGDGTESNPELAFHWIKEAVDQNYKDSYLRIAKYYLRGFGTEKSTNNFEKYCEMAIEKGDGEACLEMASYYSSKEYFATPNPDKVREYLEKGVALDDRECMAHLAGILDNSLKSDEDQLRGFELAKNAAALRSHYGEYLMARNYLYGRHVNKSIERAISYYEKGAVGIITAALELADLYYEGIEVEQSYQLAYKYFSKISDASGRWVSNNETIVSSIYYKLAQCNLEGFCRGDRTEEYLFNLRKSSSLGYGKAYGDLGALYYRGQIVEKSESLAFEYLVKAYGKGYYDHADLLTYLYVNGIGTAANEDAAREIVESVLENDIQSSILEDLYLSWSHKFDAAPVQSENVLNKSDEMPDVGHSEKVPDLGDVFLNNGELGRILSLVMSKKNVIFSGPPGVGKTFFVKAFVQSLLGEHYGDQSEFVQFHQSYTYEDFIGGYRPTADGGFEPRDGVFLEFCERARSKDVPYFFIIDEINRGNLSKIFGECLMLIEKGHRNECVRLAYNGKPFSVPDNVYILGMMNTADRSIALIDYALRRRFSFYEMTPAFDNEKFIESVKGEGVKKAIGKIRELNQDIANDESLGTAYCIGHSYFCGISDDNLSYVINFDILPLIKEYWYDNPDKFELWKEELSNI